MRVVLVDDHQLVRSGIRRLLDDADLVTVVGEASSGEDALELVRQTQPDVVFMDVSMPGIGGLEATRKLLRIDPDLRIVALSIHVEEPYPSRLLEAGAMGYITKSCDTKEIMGALQAMRRGERYIGNDIAQQMALAGFDGGGSGLDKLSQREIQVMIMVTQGYKNQEISDTLCLSPKTVSTYRHRLFEKLGVESDVELTHVAIRHGMLDQMS